ncbi:NPCBM/NEW2 domain-containing protein [Paraburkholderia sp. DHOC27]|uniref:NPCBM/NEW2 domain-containing protein n=1 Tax=Paraburkholderia sp. DHOC27 TaxID=2303330 RepID=UPI0015F34D75|nr:NPCBM/NEW2 domain-containing protein [Paraburkholderia sp. DHOC27]
MRARSTFRALLNFLLLTLSVALAGCGGGVNSPGAISNGQPDPGIALTQVRFKTPPLGWNSWNTFGCKDTEAIIKSVADAIASNGMAAAGYQYVTVDDCWVGGRNATTGQLYSNATTFPDGIAALAAYVHGKGLKFGLYTSGGTNTCAGLAHGTRPPSYPPGVGAGSLGHESVDAQTFANWGVDYIKLDYCGGSLTAFPAMRAGIAATGRTMFLSINPYSANTTLPTNFASDGTLYVPAYADMSRISQDISAKFTSVTSIIDTSAADVAWAVPGYFNDMDMLEVGNGMTQDQDTAHFIMWSIMSSGLNAGNDVRSQSAATQALLTNANVIAVNQDALALQAVLDTADSAGSLQVWTKPLATTGTRAVAFLNRGATAAPITVNFANLGLSGPVQATNVLTGASLGTVTQSLTQTVPATGAVLVKLTGTDPVASNGPLALQSWVWSAVQSGNVAVKVFPNGSPLPTGATATGAVVVHGVSYIDGLTVNAPAQLVYRLNGKCTTFQSDIGLDAAAQGGGTVDYQVWADNVELYDSGLVANATPIKTVKVSVAGRNTLRLVITDGADGVTNDVADWANPSLACSSS